MSTGRRLLLAATITAGDSAFFAGLNYLTGGNWLRAAIGCATVHVALYWPSPLFGRHPEPTEET